MPYSWNEEDLKELFRQVGRVTEKRIIRNRDTQESLGYGFVTVDCHPHGPGHWRVLQGSEVDGFDRNGKQTRRVLTIDIARGLKKERADE